MRITPATDKAAVMAGVIGSVSSSAEVFCGTVKLSPGGGVNEGDADVVKDE